MPTPTLAVVVPATDGPRRSTAASPRSPRPTIRPTSSSSSRRLAGAGPAEARNRGVAETNADVVLFVDSDVLVHPDAFTRVRQAFASDRAPRRGLRLVRRRRRDRRDGGGVPQPAPPRRPPALGRATSESFWAGIGAVRRDGASTPPGVRRGPLPAPVDRGHRARWPARPAGPDPPRPGDPGHASEGVVARVDGADRLRAARSPVGQPARRTPGASGDAQPRRAGAGERRWPPSPSRWGIVRRRPALVAVRARRGGRPQSRPARAPARAARARVARLPASGCTRCTS